MIANTLQVRKIMRTTIDSHSDIGCGMSWTDKTSKYDNDRRSVIFDVSCICVSDLTKIYTIAIAAFKAHGYSNLLTITATTGRIYLRCMSNIA